MRYMTIALTLALCLSACSDSSADKDGDGIINKSERALEMNSDAFIQIEPGLWETVAMFDKADMPGLPIKTQTKLLSELSKGLSSKSCVSEEEANALDADFFGGEGAKNCDYKQFDISGNKANILVSCKIDKIGIVELALDGYMDLKSSEFDTILTMKMDGIGDMKFSGKTTRNHVGDCANTASNLG